MKALILLMAATLLLWSSNAAAKEKVLQFYMHDNFNTTKTPITAVRVASPNNPKSLFGSVIVIDDPLTQGPSMSSSTVGRGQGTYMFDALTQTSLLLTFSAVFTSGAHNGSTISFHGADRFLSRREIAVIGGTGFYRFATGFAIIDTALQTNETTTLFFNVTLRT